MSKENYLRQYAVYVTFIRKKDGLRHEAQSSYLAENERQAYYMAWQEYTELVRKSWKIINVHVNEIIPT